MKLGVSSATFFPKVVTENSFRLIRDLGCKTAEVFMCSFCEYKGKYFDRILANAKAEEISIHSIHALSSGFEPELFNPNKRVKDDALAIYRRVLSAGQKLGASAYTFHGPSLLKKTPYRPDYERLAKTLNELTAIAKRYGIVLAYENVHYSLFSEPVFFAELKSRCPDLGATFDVKQAILSGIPYERYIDVMAGRIQTVHLCDIDDYGLPTLPGRGTVNFYNLFRRLKDTGFDGQLILEVYTESFEQLSELSESLEYIREAAGMMKRPAPKKQEPKTDGCPSCGRTRFEGRACSCQVNNGINCAVCGNQTGGHFICDDCFARVEALILEFRAHRMTRLLAEKLYFGLKKELREGVYQAYRTGLLKLCAIEKYLRDSFNASYLQRKYVKDIAEIVELNTNRFYPDDVLPKVDPSLLPSLRPKEWEEDEDED